MSALTHFDVRDDALILKNVAFDWLAIHLPERKKDKLELFQSYTDSHNSYL